MSGALRRLDRSDAPTPAVKAVVYYAALVGGGQ